MALLVYHDWRKVPGFKKIDMLDLVYARFEIDECASNWILSTIGTDWRNCKCRLKRNYYCKYKTDAERLKQCPAGVPFNDWKELVLFWSSKEGKVSIRAMIIRKKQQCVHTTGSMSFARVREKEKLKRGSNEEISQADMYLLTHRNKEDTDRILLEYNRQLSRNSENSKDLDTQNGIFAQVMGIDKADHVYLYRRGGTSSVMKKKKVSSLGSINALSVAENARKIVVDVMKDMKDKLQDEIQKKLEQHVQSIKAEVTDQVHMIKVAISQQFNLLMSQMQVSHFKAATFTTNDQPSTSSQMPNDGQDIEHLVSNISLSQLCKMVEVNEFPGADLLI